MRKLERFSALLCSLCCCLCFAFSIMCSGVKVYADSSTAREMSISEVRAFYGDSFTASYVVSNTTYTATFQYLESGSLSSGVTGANLAENGVADSIADFANYHYVTYQAVFDHYYNDHSIGTMTIDALGTYYPDYVRAGIACSCLFSGHSWNPFLTSSDNSRTEWANNKWGIYQALSANASADSNLANYYGAFIYDGNFYRLCAVEGDTGLYLAPLKFQNIFLYASGGQWIANIMILCPWVAADPVHDPSQTTTATTTTTAPSGSDVDLSETNGLLDRILAALQGLANSILDGLKRLFIPSDDFMDGFKDDMSDLLEDHLGGLYEAEQIMVDAFGRFPEVAAKSEIYIPPATLNLAGTPFKVGDWHVPLKVQGVPALLYEGIAWIVDFLCLAAFLRMCRNKLEIFLNPDSEVVKE